MDGLLELVLFQNGLCLIGHEPELCIRPAEDILYLSWELSRQGLEIIESINDLRNDSG